MRPTSQVFSVDLCCRLPVVVQVLHEGADHHGLYLHDELGRVFVDYLVEDICAVGLGKMGTRIQVTGGQDHVYIC